MKRYSNAFTSWCKFLTFGFIAAAAVVTWLELMINNHWIVGLLVAMVAFGAMAPMEKDYCKPD
jgi:hypothetical protein